MSMWYEFDGVLILNDSVSPGCTLICVAKPWIVESPIPLTFQSLAGSPASWFSHAIALPHAAAAGCAPTKESRLKHNASKMPITNRGARLGNTRNPANDIMIPLPQHNYLAGRAKVLAG